MHIHKKVVPVDTTNLENTKKQDPVNATEQPPTIDKTSSTNLENEAQGATSFEADQTQAQSPSQHEQPANSVSFGEPAPQKGSASETSESMQELSRLFKENKSPTDPDVLKVLDKIRNAENENIQQMLDMMQKSLDYAHKIMQRNREIYYSKTLPKLEGAKKELENLKALEKSQQKNEVQQQSQRQIAHTLQHLTREVQQVADTNVPPGHGDLMLKLEHALQMALIL